MKKIFLPVLLCLLLIGCKSTKTGATRNVELRFLDDYVISEDLEVGGTKVGGLSGIDYHEGNYFLVCDHPGNPRFYKAAIQLSGESIDTITFSEVIELNTSHPELKNKHLDLEGIRFIPEEGSFILSSEGSINNEKDPAIFTVSPEGDFISDYNIPKNFLANSDKKPRNNGIFEGLAESHDKKGYWVAMELPLKTDGPKPKLIRTKSPVRITYFDKETKEATRQFPYRLEPIAKIPWLYFAVNGVTDILEYAPNKFLIMERGFAAGHGSKGNTVRIFDVDATLGTNTLDRNNLKVSFYNPAKKKLIYDFKWATKFLTEGIIDNIEGMTFGPTLPNGNKSLILVSDNNFNSLGKQLNQVILMEINLKN
ncbi:esterase-like activity of phytase family protein [Salinimicrobium sp. GXAS 041]|uniref:esterase-like activity of phytase family protein n=1 Tax=Salinimicrobium sp. GXAS 041 TaxID=3400806 RepID=UPI003C739CE1